MYVKNYRKVSSDSTNDQLADVLTKALPGTIWGFFRILQIEGGGGVRNNQGYFGNLQCLS